MTSEKSEGPGLYERAEQAPTSYLLSRRTRGTDTQDATCTRRCWTTRKRTRYVASAAKQRNLDNGMSQEDADALFD